MEIYEDFEHTYWYVKDEKDRDDFMVQASPEFLRSLHKEKMRVVKAHGVEIDDGQNKTRVEVAPCSTHTFKVLVNDVIIQRWKLKHCRTFKLSNNKN